jgi:hypothetical protein
MAEVHATAAAVSRRAENWTDRLLAVADIDLQMSNFERRS